MIATAYYNEIDPYAAQWLRNLIDAGHIASGVVDERSILDVRAADLAGFTQCHFFAGIGGWSLALRLAGWPDDRPVWTGSCPCQPFSAAGQRRGFADERHLWPAWFGLVAQCRPGRLYGEQVADVAALKWWDAVRADLEHTGYACAAADLCAAGVGAPHIRQRLYWLANDDGEGLNRCGAPWLHERRARARGDKPEARDADRAFGHDAHRCSEVGGLADDDGSRCAGISGHGQGGIAQRGEAGFVGDADEGRGRWDGRAIPREESEAEGGLRRVADSIESAGATRGPLGHAADPRPQGRDEPGQRADAQREAAERAGAARDVADAASAGWRSDRTHVVATHGAETVRAGTAQLGRCYATRFWDACEWIACRDGKRRPVEPGTFPLAHGVPARVGRLRAYGNAIVPPLAAEFIRATQ